MASPADRASQVVQPIERARRRLKPECLFDSAIFFWRGTSGHAYVHTIYSLKSCPAVPEASVLFVRKSPDGNRLPLAVHCVHDPVPTLNLARIRQTGARLGANEVHLHFATGNRINRQTAAADLHTRHGHLKPVGA